MIRKCKLIKAKDGEKAARLFMDEYAMALDALESRLREIPAFKLAPKDPSNNPPRRIPLQDLIDKRQDELARLRAYAPAR